MGFVKDDPVLNEIDAEIQRIRDELTKALEFRSWWKARHVERVQPSTVPARRTEHGPTARDWISQALGQGSRLGAAEIARKAVDLGWITTSKTPSIVIRNNLLEMEKKGEVVRDGNKWMLPISPVRLRPVLETMNG